MIPECLSERYMAKRESSRSATLEIGSVVDATTAGEAAVERV